MILSGIPGINFYYGGTSLLIVVAVALDTVSQIEAYQVMNRYDGFMETGRVRRRRPSGNPGGNPSGRPA